jgi:bifunctional non-homologous end joining protein LigD
LAQGELKFVLHGKKLRGGFVLIRTGLRSAGALGKQSWLLIKRQDEYADPAWNIDRYDWSVLTGRSLDEIAAGRSRTATSRARSS